MWKKDLPSRKYVNKYLVVTNKAGWRGYNDVLCLCNNSILYFVQFPCHLNNLPLNRVALNPW